ncbi:MAG TPA: hypothetical protein V6C72_05890 [Chroococcales cyanobacterium]
MLQDLKTKVSAGQIRLSDALSSALPDFRGKIPDDRLMWLVNEMQGYPNALDWYSRPMQDFPPYRVVAGQLKLVDREGNMGDVNHPLAQRQQYFLAAPVSWLEEAANMPGSVAMVEMQELSSYFKTAGGVACLCNKDEIKRILNSFRQSFLALIDEVLTRGPA